MLTTKLQGFFQNYLEGFQEHNLAKIKACYQLPCTLNTPDRLLLVTSEDKLQSAMEDIFTQLVVANTQTIIATNASYTALKEDLLLVCIDWQFLAKNEQLFADFCALYHVTMTDEQLKIVNVISHESGNSVTLAQPFTMLNHKR